MAANVQNAIHKITNLAASPSEALATSAKLVQDDLVLMVEREGETAKGIANTCRCLQGLVDGQYHLDAGAVCLPGFWRLQEKFQMSLDTLHFEAKVPHYATKLQKSMNRFFKTMLPEKPVTRNNFFIQLDDGLHWSHRMADQDKVEQVACECLVSQWNAIY